MRSPRCAPGPRYAVEVRHDAFFSGGVAPDDLLALLRERGADLVTMDTRGLHTGKSLALAEVRARKPNLPVHVRATADRPIVRTSERAPRRARLPPFMPDGIMPSCI